MFAVDANHLCFFMNSAQGVSLKFDEKEIMQDVKILKDINVDTNMWDNFRGKLTHSFIHPHSMHFIAGFEEFKAE